MKRFYTVLIGAMLAIVGAAASERHHSILSHETEYAVRVVSSEGQVEDMYRLMMPGSGQALISGEGCCRMVNQGSGTSWILLDFGRELCGSLHIVTGMSSKPEGRRVRIRFGESVAEACSDIGKPSATNDHAMRDFETELPWLGSWQSGQSGFRFVRIDFLSPDATLLLREVKVESTWSDDPVIGKFKCSDSRLNDIWETGARTVHLNMQDYIWDGIKRDRLVWIGDMYTEVMTISNLFDNTDLVTRSLDFARDATPLPGWMNNMSGYSLCWLMIQREWYRYKGDLDYLKEQRTYLKGLLKQMMEAVDEQGHEHLVAGRFLDWPSSADQDAVSCGLHAMMMMALEQGAELCDVLGETVLASECRACRGRMQDAAGDVQKLYASSSARPDAPGRKQAVSLMSLAGIYDAFRAADAVAYNGGHGFSTYYGYFMLEALASAGRYQEAMDIISEYWGAMLDLGATSFWEDFDLDWTRNAGRIDEMPQSGKVDIHAAYGGYCYVGYRHSLCHGWASGATAWLSRYVLGLLPADDGESIVNVDPHLCSLSWAEGRCPTPYGPMSIRVERLSDGRTLATVDAPQEITLVAGHDVVIARRGLDLGTASLEEIEQGFQNVPDSVRTAVYWYWLSDTATEEGVVKDLEAMKKAGITRAQIGMIAESSVASGQTTLFSDRWWKVLHAALKKASELDIEIGIFNCPGWSQSGGPWVKEEQSMRYVACEETLVEGNGDMQEIAVPEGVQPVAVMAWPEITGQSRTWKVSGQGRVQMTLDEPMTVRSISVKVSREMPATGMRLIAEGSTVKEFSFDRHRSGLMVGFNPEAPVVVAVPEVAGVDFMFEIDSPGDAEYEITLSEIPVMERYPEKSLAKMFQEPLPLWGEYMWETPELTSDESLKIHPSETVYLTSSVGDGVLRWDVPDGKWTVATYYMKTTGVTNSPAMPEATGLEADKMSRKHIESHFESYLGEIIRRIPAEDRKTWKVVVEDSYETGGLNWTDDMEDVFRNTYGYDPVPYLPVLCGHIVESEDKSERFLWDLRRLIADRVAYDYVGGLRDVSHRYGLETWLECYGHWGFPGEFLQYGGQSDQVAGEFWSEGSLGDIENRAASSAGHIYGKNEIWAESCTAGGPGFSRYPRVMKQRVDRFFTEGINSSLLHLYVQQPDDRLPGVSAWYGNEFNRNNTWFCDLDLFTSYLRRCNYLLQQGRYVADVAYFIGEDAPKMTGACVPALPYGYSFDYINAEVLQKHARVTDGELVLDSGMHYKVLVLPKQKTMRPELLEVLEGFAKAGLAIVGPAPEKSPSLEGWPHADEYVSTVASDMWKLQNVYPDGTELGDVFKAKGMTEDFRYVNRKDNILFIHRTLGEEGDIYFLSNQEDRQVTVRGSFKVAAGLKAELWNPVTGERKAASSERYDDHTVVEISLDRLESVFVVFRRNTDARVAGNAHTMAVKGPWTVSFGPSAGNTGFTVTMDSPVDWKDSADERIKHFSGTATYSVDLGILKSEAKASKVELDLGMAMVTAKVYVNGQYAGGAWTYPYRVDVTGLLKAGTNRIEIAVTNNWQNRLIGDSQKIESMRKTWTSANPWKPDSELQSSGLIGPVNLIIYK